MQHSFKLLLNTIASYAKIIINTLVTIFATRIALKALGAEDFGIYNLIAGIIVMLSFINGSLMISSQRFFSISIGAKSINKLNANFNASLGIHILLSICIAVAFIIISPILFGGFLNIEPEQISSAKSIYYIMIISSVFTIGSIPFSALMNAYEDMIALSLIDILACILKFIAAFSLLFFSTNLLEWYAFLMMISVVVKMFLEFLWCKKKYSKIELNLRMLYNRNVTREMLGFVGWNTMGAFAVIVGNQGIAVVLNIFFGTIINAAYGIANQVNSLVLSFASTLTTVFTPMIIQAKGAGNNKRMLMSAILSSKLSFLLSSVLALPILIHLSDILKLWLGNTPPVMTEIFCFYIVISFLVVQLYPGINRAIYASGKIKGYQLSLTIILVSTIPLGVLLFNLGYPAYSILKVKFILQVIVLVSTIYYASKICQLNWQSFVIYSILFPVIIFASCMLLRNVVSVNNVYYNILLSVLFLIAYVSVYYMLVFDGDEKKLFKNLLLKIKNKLCVK